MAFEIQGNSKGNVAGVTDEFRLEIDSVSIPRSDFRALQGHGYNFNTGSINITNGSEAALAYLENNDSLTMVITGIFYLMGNTTNGGATEDFLFQVIRNPTLGTLISGGTAQAPVNRNHNSSNPFVGTALKGAVGNTVTDGIVEIESLFATPDRKPLNVGAIVLEKGNSIAVKYTPKASNTNQDIQIAIAFYMLDKTLVGL